MFVKFGAYLPDLDETTRDILVAGTVNVVPSNRGYRGANDWSPVARVESLTATCNGLWYARRTTQTNRLFAGTSMQLWERQSGSWVARVPAAITVSAVERWQFAQVGDVTLAGSKDTQPLQFETTTATTIVSMPRYACIDTVGEFVMIGNVITSVTFSDPSGVNIAPGEYPDRWWCSALGNYADYAPSLATQAATNRLTDLPGPLTCGRQLGERFVFYKARGIWVGTYEGVPFIWSWAQASTEVGTFGQNCVVPVNYAHFFVGNDNFYIFDGAQVRPIGEGIREWFFARLQKQHANLIIGVHDEYSSLIYWWYPGPDSSNRMLDEFVVYNYEVNKWGYGRLTIQAAASYLVDELTYDQLWVGYNFDAVPNTTFDSAYFQAESFVPVFINGNKALATLFGTHLGGTIKTSWGGDDTRLSLVRRVRARWNTAPVSAILTPYRVMLQGNLESAGTPRTMSDARFDFTQVARWHRFAIATTGNWESPGADVEAAVRGRE